jgi:Trk K+ transport system NAD-binding subunit
MSLRINIVGGGVVGRYLAVRLTERGDDICVIEQNERQARAIEESGARVVIGDGTDIETLDAAGTADVDVFVTATGDDDTNLLAAQLALSRFDIDRVIARVNRDENAGPFEDLGIHAISTSEATARELDNRIERPSFTGFIEELSHSGDAQEIELRNPEHDGRTIGELDNLLPEQCLIVMITHEELTRFPNADNPVMLGDRITVLGERGAVETARNLLATNDSTAPQTPPPS